MNPILAMSLCEVAAAIREQRVSSVEVTAACIAQGEALGAELNCIARWEPEAALAAAAAADAALQRGGSIGPLQGVPLAHKDLFSRGGLPVAAASLAFADYRPPATATVLRHFEAAGAVTLGALQLSELAMSPTGYSEWVGHGINPWNPQHVPGGSSFGSGAAVAAHICFAALGTDTAGSVRLPATLCGLAGLKPTNGRIDSNGCLPLAQTLDCIGPLARTVEDCALLQYIADGSVTDAESAEKQLAKLRTPLDGLRIGLPREYFFDGVDPQVAALIDSCIAQFRDMGVSVVDAPVPDMHAINRCSQTVFLYEAQALHGAGLAAHPERYGQQVRDRLRAAAQCTQQEYEAILAQRQALQQSFISTAMADVDLLLTPAVLAPTPTIVDTTSGEFEQLSQHIDRMRHCVRPFNFLGLPCLSVPGGFTEGELPNGFQLVGRPGEDELLLRAGYGYQQVTGWHKGVPPLAR
jgi:aspartyl-tRNA(Asn)/glutamyl-tRNA(Gln) amidotransferase subunit A